MPEYEVINLPENVKWVRIDGIFYVDEKYLEDFLVKLNKYKKDRAA